MPSWRVRGWLLAGPGFGDSNVLASTMVLRFSTMRKNVPPKLSSGSFSRGGVQRFDWGNLGEMAPCSRRLSGLHDNGAISSRPQTHLTTCICCGMFPIHHLHPSINIRPSSCCFILTHSPYLDGFFLDSGDQDKLNYRRLTRDLEPLQVFPSPLHSASLTPPRQHT